MTEPATKSDTELSISRQSHSFWCTGKILLIAEILLLLPFSLAVALLLPGDESMDAVSYFEIAEGILTHHWHLIVNGYWNPGYAFVISLSRSIAHAGIGQEWPLARITNLALLALFALSIVVFICALREGREYGWDLCEPLPSGTRRISALGLLIFSLAMLLDGLQDSFSPKRVNPDLMVNMIYVLLMSLLVNLPSRQKIWRYALIGVLCGAGYLVKAIFFPLSLLLIVMLAFVGTKRKRAIAGAALAGLIFCAIAGPYVAALSRSKGHFSYNDSGRLNFIWLVNGFPRPPMLPSQNGKVDVKALGLKHPVHVLQTQPYIASFGGELEGGYPLWTDASYWLDGVKVPFSPTATIKRLLLNFENLLATLAAFPFCTGLVIAMAILMMRTTPWLLSLRKLWPCLLLSAAMIAAYMIIEVDPRYVAPAIMTIFLLILGSLEFRRETLGTVGVSALLAALVVGTGLRQFATTRPMLIDAAKEGHLSSALSLSPHWLDHYRDTAESLRDLHFVAPGDAIACIGSESCDDYWLRLTGLHVVSQAEYLENELQTFWELTPDAREAILERLASTNAKLVISRRGPAAPVPDGWFRLEKSDVVVRPLANPELGHHLE